MMSINKDIMAWGCDSPRPQSGPLNPKKQWHVPDTQSPFPKQLLGQSSIESAKRAIMSFFLSNVVWKTIFLPLIFSWLIIILLLMTVISTGCNPVNVSIPLQNTNNISTQEFSKTVNKFRSSANCHTCWMHWTWSDMHHLTNLIWRFYGTLQPSNLKHQQHRNLHFPTAMGNVTVSYFLLWTDFQSAFMYLQKQWVGQADYFVFLFCLFITMLQAGKTCSLVRFTHTHTHTQCVCMIYRAKCHWLQLCFNVFFKLFRCLRRYLWKQIVHRFCLK